MCAVILLLIGLGCALSYWVGRVSGRWDGYHDGYEDGSGDKWGRAGSKGDA